MGGGQGQGSIGKGSDRGVIMRVEEVEGGLGEGGGVADRCEFRADGEDLRGRRKVSRPSRL